MTNYIEWIPQVNETQEFIEIAFDFSNPLDLVREAISNSFDASATEILLNFSVISKEGERILKINIRDNGCGMDENGLHSFFDLGNSMSKDNPEKIGEKGHGTKVYVNSTYIQVETQRNGIKYTATMKDPKKKLYNNELPKVTIEYEEVDSQESWTNITILGYNNNRTDHFTHEELKDYILWFTKMGSIEKEFGITKNDNVILKLKGNDRDDSEGYEVIKFGHVFPNESNSINELFSQHSVDAPNHYCKRWVFEGVLPSQTDIKYQAVFYLEGKKVKQGYNRMVPCMGRKAILGSYTVQDRYGLYLCKDFIPIKRKNEWITKKGSEFTKFHAFVNCQKLRLTANRGSFENTPSEILQDLQNEIQKHFYNEIITDSAFDDIEYLESEADAYYTEDREEKDYAKRIQKINRSNIAIYKELRLIEPQREQGVYSLYMQLNQCEKELFPFIIVDYDTHSGIDVIVKDKNNSVPLKQDTLYYVEFKYILERNFNHSFKHLHSIICWDINLKNGEIVEDISKKKRKLEIIMPINENDYTRYYLNDERGNYKIEIFVLKDYLKQKLGIDFRPRTEKDCF